MARALRGLPLTTPLCIGPVDEIIRSFDKVNNVATPSSHHSVPAISTDRDHIIKELLQYEIFSIKPGREHRCFKKFTCNVMKTVNKNQTINWMGTQYTKLVHLLALQS